MLDLLNTPKLIESVLNNGASKVATNVIQTKNLFASFNSRLPSIHIDTTHDFGIGFTIHTLNQKLFFSSNTFEDLLNSISKRMKIISSSNQNVEDDTPSTKAEINRENDNIVFKKFNNDFQEFTEIIRDTISENIEKDIKFSTNILLEKENRNFLSSNQANILQKNSFLEVKILLERKSQSGVVRKYLTMGGLSEDNFNLEKLEDRIKSNSKELSKITHLEKLDSGRYDLLMSEEPSWTFIHETVGHAVEADSILSKQSFASKLLGRKIANDNVTVIDDPLIKSSGMLEFDDEGTKCSGTVIVENGLLTEFLHNIESSKYFNQLSTGNSRMSSYFNEPLIRQTNLFIEPHNYTDEELLESNKNGLFVDGATFASTQIETGDFQMFAELFYQIKNGEIQKPVVPGFIVGNAVESLHNINKVGKMIENYPAYCMKENQNIKTGMISPKISINNMEVIF
jgi:predicted Zn-dependent protease